MIILIGPDGTGKSVLAASLKKLTGKPVFHHTYRTKYMEYLEPLAKLDMYRAVLDRHIWCEYAYAPLLGRKVQFSTKQMDNVTWLTLIQDPVVVLCVHKPREQDYKDDYVPYELWSAILSRYEKFLALHQIGYTIWDYPILPLDVYSRQLLDIESEKLVRNSWWLPLWKAGYGPIGSAQPETLIIAETLGPYNYRKLPFEQGPTGYMMSELLEGTAKGTVALTNWKKTLDNKANSELLNIELSQLKPKKAVVMGKVAKSAINLLKKYSIPHKEVLHLGYINRNKHLWEDYKENWRTLWQPVTERTRALSMPVQRL